MTDYEKWLEQQVFDQRQKHYSIFARRYSICGHCDKRISNGDRIVTMQKNRWVHAKCADDIIRAKIEDELAQAEQSQDYDEGAVLSGRADQQRMDAEYAQGYAEAKQYSSDVKTYGREQADQWEMEAEMARYNRGEDW